MSHSEVTTKRWGVNAFSRYEQFTVAKVPPECEMRRTIVSRSLCERVQAEARLWDRKTLSKQAEQLVGRHALDGQRRESEMQI